MVCKLKEKLKDDFDYLMCFEGEEGCEYWKECKLIKLEKAEG